MKALTIHQPYAHLIVAPRLSLPVGAVPKRVENRRWATTYRGRLLIHAGRSLKWINGGDWPFIPDKKLTYDDFPDFEFGAIVGVATLVECMPLKAARKLTDNQPYGWVKNHFHTVGPVCWVLARATQFEKPIPYRGAQGLFDVPDDFQTLEALAASERNKGDRQRTLFESRPDYH